MIERPAALIPPSSSVQASADQGTLVEAMASVLVSAGLEAALDVLVRGLAPAASARGAIYLLDDGRFLPLCGRPARADIPAEDAGTADGLILLRERGEVIGVLELDPAVSPSVGEPVASLLAVGAGRALQDRKLTAEQNRQVLTQQLLERLYDALPTAVAVTDPASHALLSVNPAFCDLIGYEEDEVLGLRPPFPWWGSAPPELTEEEWGAGESLRRLEALFRRREGQLVPVEVVRLMIRDAWGAEVAEVHLGTDLSERRRFEQQLLQSGKLATIGELAAGVAHEINNPLFAILGLAEFLLKDAEPGTKAHERLCLIQQTGLEIKEIVRALLDFARERSDEHSVISLGDVVAQTVELARRTSSAKSIEISEVYSDTDTRVSASANQLKQIFLNLLTNAQQAMPEGGAVAIALERQGDWVQASVTDTGPGIEESVLQRIFEPFFTTRRSLGGTGLGLSVSLGIAQMHGGELFARAGEGGGTTFFLRLPAYREGEQ